MSNKLVLHKNIQLTPVPSHGGPARAIVWELYLNDVQVMRDIQRYDLRMAPDLCIWSSEIQSLTRALEKALNIEYFRKVQEYP